jgi:tetratricopeptide (TPR) repeat protein
VRSLRALLGRAAWVLVVGALASVSAAQDAPPPPRGPAPPNPPNLGPPSPPADKQAMWPAATAEEWKRPVLIPFQRTWEDAVAVAKEEGKQILVCINMDGEIASEHFAGVRYRDPDAAKLYEPYVCVVCSVYRHTERDYDEQGRRILCPRFGSVTCGEHIAMEGVCFEKFMEGKRVSPRHIAVALDGTKKYDVYYINDVEHVLYAIKEWGAAPTQPPVVRGDRPIVDRVASRELSDRAAVEAAYQNGDAATRKSLLDAAAKTPGTAPLDLLRLAVFGLDVDMSKRARQALSKTNSADATDLVSDALRVPMDAPERDALIATLSRLGETSVRAKFLATVHQGAGATSAAVDAKSWARVGGEYPAPAYGLDENGLDARRRKEIDAKRAHPDDPNAHVDFADASLMMAMEERRRATDDSTSSKMAERLLLEDARASGLAAEKLGATGWRVNAVIALAAYYQRDKDAAYARAEAAAKDIPAGEKSWESMAVLTVFSEARWNAIKSAALEKRQWPAQWLADLHAANTVILRHPLGTIEQALLHYDALAWLGAKQQAADFLDETVVRFPASDEAHMRLRRRILQEKGVAGLEPTYEAMLRDKPGVKQLEWFAGEASRVTGDFRRRKNAADEALAAYDRAIAHYEKAIVAEPARRDAPDEAIAIALAGKARIEFDAGDLDKATTDIVASFDRRPQAAGILDGTSMAPVSTAHAIMKKAEDLKRDDVLKKLAEAMKKIDPALVSRGE